MPTNLDDITAIRTRFIDLWSVAHPAVPFALDNEPPIETPTRSIWARLDVIPGAERKRILGSAPRYEQIGRVYFRVYAPAGEANGEPWALAESFAAIFREWDSPDFRIRLDTPDFSSGIDDDGDFMVMVSIPYTAQH